jgi:hypothetical protein
VTITISSASTKCRPFVSYGEAKRTIRAWTQQYKTRAMLPILRILRDSVVDFIAWRNETFVFELAALPRSLQLDAAESRIAPYRRPTGMVGVVARN